MLFFDYYEEPLCGVLFKKHFKVIYFSVISSFKFLSPPLNLDVPLFQITLSCLQFYKNNLWAGMLLRKYFLIISFDNRPVI